MTYIRETNKCEFMETSLSKETGVGITYCTATKPCDQQNNRVMQEGRDEKGHYKVMPACGTTPFVKLAPTTDSIDTKLE